MKETLFIMFFIIVLEAFSAQSTMVDQSLSKSEKYSSHHLVLKVLALGNCTIEYDGIYTQYSLFKILFIF